jgi:hypothetical protein
MYTLDEATNKLRRLITLDACKEGSSAPIRSRRRNNTHMVAFGEMRKVAEKFTGRACAQQNFGFCNKYRYYPYFKLTATHQSFKLC